MPVEGALRAHSMLDWVRWTGVKEGNSTHDSKFQLPSRLCGLPSNCHQSPNFAHGLTCRQPETDASPSCWLGSEGVQEWPSLQPTGWQARVDKIGVQRTHPVFPMRLALHGRLNPEGLLHMSHGYTFSAQGIWSPPSTAWRERMD